MNGLKHPFSRALYEQDGHGLIKVTRPDGVWGLFQIDGRWARGELRECDPLMCNWIGGPQVGNHRVTAS